MHMLTGKNTLREVSVEELRTIADQQPYFSVVQLLLAKKMKQDQHPGFHQQLHKTSLYFPNTHWLHYQLNQEDEEVNEEQEYRKSDTINADFQPISQAPAFEEDIALATEEEQVETLDSVPETEVPLALSKVIAEQAKEFQKPVNVNLEIPAVSEPYHTIDYFASQGIKLDRNLPAQDQLESKVRKFTDWLKQMKRGANSAQPADLGTSSESENIVKGIAEHSNETKDVVTESMADVLLMQGKAEKAIQIYIKLSFMHPDKSAYYASKIQSLKGI